MIPEPVLLQPSAFDHFYRGGANISALRGSPPGTHRPEEWLGSTVERWGLPGVGLTSIGSTALRDAISSDPDGWLGSDHVARFGDNPAILVKLLDAGQRLPVHVHPTRRFARSHLDCPFGKTEAWVVLEGEQSSGTVFIGTKRPVRPEEWAELVDAQETEAMLELLVPIEVSVGDGIVVPSGTPHCTGEGLFVIELQEPTDFSLLLEWDGFAVDGAVDGHLGLGFDVALGMVRRDAFDDAAVDRLIRRHRPIEAATPTTLMPAVAEPYFRAWGIRATADRACPLPPGFGILLVTDGTAELRSFNGSLPVAPLPVEPLPVERGDVLVIPAAAAPLELHGDVSSIFAQPPSPDAPDPVEWDGPEPVGVS